MRKSKLASRIFELEGFKIRYKELAIDSVKRQFGDCLIESRNAESIEWAYLLEVANVLAQSEEGRNEEAALRIAQHCLNTKDIPFSYHEAACVILDTLTNRAALNLAIKKQLIPENVLSQIPALLKIDRIRRELFYTEKIGAETRYLNRYQKHFWDSLKLYDQLSTSAPTSTGKSFLIKSWIGELIGENDLKNVIYIVPTRALISQVEFEFKEYFANNKKVNVASVPSKKSVKENYSNLLVLTQERLHLLLSEFDNIHIDALIVDEAHKIGDGSRGVLLEQAINSIQELNEKLKIIYASPLVSNPDILLSKSNGDKNAVISSEHTTVNQNQLWISQLPSDQTLWTVEYCFNEALIELGKIKLPFRPTHVSKRLTFIAYVMSSKEGGNLIYVNGAAEAEKVAQQLWELVGVEDELNSDEEIKDLIDLVKSSVHPKYALSLVLTRGIAFHYGNMPLNIKEEIERLYSKNKIKFLICTSTLVEGVNLPCKTIFIRGPQKGRGKPMNASDFWNLCGRAGRLGKEFQGNIVCIDPKLTQVWPSPPPRKRLPQNIIPTTDLVFSNLDNFLMFIESEKVGETFLKSSEFESVYSLIAIYFLKTGSLEDCSGINDLTKSEILILENKLKDNLSQISIPFSLIKKNPGISPAAMQSLFNYFINYEKDLEELIPLLPEHQNAVQMYTRVFKRIDKYLSKSFHAAFRDAMVVVSWMRGYPLSRIILERIKVKQKKQIAFALPSMIRDTMEDVEKIARFLAPRYTSCYLDLLRHCFILKNRHDLIEKLPPLHLWLEYGTSQQTQLSLISIGLSRSCAISLSELIVDDQLDENQVINWLKTHELESLPLPKLTRDEILRVKDLL